MRILLDQADINPDLADKNGRTPLSWTAQHGYEAVVRLLLNRADVNPNLADDEYGQTPLSWAADHGYDGVVSSLLDQPNVNSFSTNSSGQTMLHSVFSAVRGPRRARRGDCQEPGTGRDGKT